jgi:hypothetical protein
MLTVCKAELSKWRCKRLRHSSSAEPHSATNKHCGLRAITHRFYCPDRLEADNPRAEPHQQYREALQQHNQTNVTLRGLGYKSQNTSENQTLALRLPSEGRCTKWAIDRADVSQLAPNTHMDMPQRGKTLT